MSTSGLTCPNCNSENQRDSRYCNKCGYPLHSDVTDNPIAGEQSPSTTIAISAHKICSGCQTANNATAKYCYRCGLLLPMETEQEAAVTEALAGFWIRLAAYIIDSIALYAVDYLINLGLHLSVDPTQGLAVFDDPKLWISQAISFVLYATYFTFCTGKWGQTLGKRATGVKVVRTDGSSVSYLRSLARYLASILSGLTLGIGYLMIAFSANKRGLHDLICGTKVIKIRK